MVVTGLCDRSAYEQPRHITWLFMLNDSRDNATASAGADAHLQSPRVREVAKVPDARAVSGESCYFKSSTT